MGKFKNGDRVVNRFGDTATVIESTELIAIQWDAGVIGCHYASAFELLARKFEVGQFVRIIADDETNGEVGFIFEDDGDDELSDPYHVVLFNEDGNEEWYSANEMVLWSPKVGERVVESDVEDDEGGTVLAVGSNGIVKVLWDSFPHAQDWKATDLEPEDPYEDELKEGDEVVYTNPMFSGSCNAVVTKTDGEAVSVKFIEGPMRDGVYHRDFFTKAA